MNISSLNELIHSARNVHDNIEFLGLLSTEEYLRVLDKCTIALSLRNPEDLEHQNNFPSKIIEYLSKGKLVISTIKYQDIPEDVLTYCDFNHISLASKIHDLLDSDFERLLKRRIDGVDFARTNYSKEALSHKVNILLKN
jgi:hypothetical protein